MTIEPLNRLTDPDLMATFLKEQGFDFNYYTRWGYYFLEIGGLTFDDGMPILEKIYDSVCLILEGRIPTTPDPCSCYFEVKFEDSSRLEELRKLEQETRYLNEFGFRIRISNNSFLLGQLKPLSIQYPHTETPVFMSILEQSRVLEYEDAKTFIHSLYPALHSKLP